MEFTTLGPNHTLLRLQKGEPLVETVTRFAARHEVGSAQVTAIGALEDVELAYFDRQRREYLKRRFSDVYELVSLVGNVAWVDGSPFFHLHACLGDRDFGAVCGHLVEGTVAVTAEVTLLTSTQRVERRLDESIGLKLLDL